MNSKAPQPTTAFEPNWIAKLDGRTGIAQEMRTRWRTMTDDLGGEDGLSYAQRSLVERALWLEFWLREQERSLAQGDEFDVGKWVQAANSLQGILAKLGLERVARDVPSLNDFIKARVA
ncbi:hypothetical protein R0135_00575 [Congregibacter variabilis]|uniref:Uncharacterized protein n=1 Tax=Congregibacter variabilis TaxID=3081200 RepID=A0ABZ0I3R6_9GAMM|nr:hypothetical protein R0135_00575 [Congregibacter sp. IMCC43200]